MFNKGDLIIYSSIGICRIDDICEKTFAGQTRNYYVLQPIEDNKLTIHNPVDNDKIAMLGIITDEEARKILESFNGPGVPWVEKGHDRIKLFSDIVKSGDRKEISKVVNTLMRKKYEVERNEKRLSESDNRLLHHIQNILFKEVAISLNTTYDEVHKEVTRLIKANSE